MWGLHSIRVIYNSIIDTRSQPQHATNAQLHANGKNSPFSHPLRFPYKIHERNTCLSFKSEMEKRCGKKENKVVRLGQGEAISLKMLKGEDPFTRHNSWEFG